MVARREGRQIKTMEEEMLQMCGRLKNVQTQRVFLFRFEFWREKKNKTEEKLATVTKGVVLPSNTKKIPVQNGGRNVLSASFVDQHVHAMFGL
jgi:hypothetical protein